MIEIFKNFLEFLLQAKDFEIYIVDSEQELSDTVNFFISSIDEEDENKKEDMIDWVCNLDRIIWCTLWLDHKDYNKIISEWQGREYIKNEQFITNVVNNENNQMMIVQFIRVKNKNQRKTVEEFQNELDEAVTAENYEVAAKLKKKIKGIQDREKHNLEKIREALKVKNKNKRK